jgi:hypothetical protein
MFKSIIRAIKGGIEKFKWFFQWVTIYIVIWALSGFFMQLMISNKVKDDGE